MGCASSKPRKQRASTAEEALGAVADEVTFEVDGKARHLHMKPTKSGRFLLGTSDEPMPEEEYKEMRTILEEDPAAAEKAHELAKAGDMGLQIGSAGSPAFIGVLVVRVLSASLTDFKNPEIQLAAEDDKSKRIRHNTGKGDNNADVAVPSSVSSDSGVGRDLQHNSSLKVRDFTWDSSFKLVFVVVYSHAALKISMKDRAPLSMGPTTTAEGMISIADLAQGDSRYTVQLHNKNRQVGSVDIEVDYKWLRGTHDDGNRVRTLSLTVNRRKLKDLRSVVAHVSNVNHWMLSHDNVWAVLHEQHPALKRSSQADAAGRSSFHDSKHHHSTSAATGSQADSSTSSHPVDGSRSLQKGQVDLSGPSDGGRSSASDMRQSKDRSTDLATVRSCRSQAVPVIHAADRLVQGKNTNGSFDPGVSDLSSQSSEAGLTRQQIAERRLISRQYDVVEGAKQNPYTLMFEYSILDCLTAKEGDSEESSQLKSQLASIFALVNDRLSTLEDTVRAQQEMLMEVSYQVDSKENGPKLPFISGKFSYGLGRPAAKRSVLLFASQSQTGPANEEFPCAFLGQHRTDSNGTLGPIYLQESMVTKPGHYNVLALLPEDNTCALFQFLRFARGSLFILEPGTKCVMFDLDGTITVGDHEVVAQFALNAVAASLDVSDRMLTQAWDQKSRAHARTVCRLWAAKGYQVIYLSGRQGSFYNLTLSWLIKHHFPPGPIHLTRTHVPTLPVYISVGNFKVQYMESLQKKGFELYAAYGNTGTDVRAYEAAGIPKDRTFTIGQAAGYGGTQRIQNFTRHLAKVVDFPDSDVPIPYVDLLYVALPQYRSGSSGKKVRADSDTCGAISGPNDFREEFAASALTVNAADKAVEDSAADEVDLSGSQPVDVNVTEDDDDESGDDDGYN